MVALVVANTILMILLSVVTVGLLRSHAEILNRLGEEGENEETNDMALPGPRANQPPASDLAGEDLDGSGVQMAMRGRSSTLIAFLSSGCLTCLGLWEDLRHDPYGGLPSGTRLVAVTKSRDQESPSRLAELAPDGLPLVMSTQAWSDYQIVASPYFVYVDGRTGTVRSEGTAERFPQVLRLLKDAIADEELAVQER